ncbi:hypothetical protein DFJ63DRAFT_242101 [Scheffersomyces coipomensis]|uniref:uncharacterized protein n=1 Tax=Scheffersomyces coipomensis TaxID=1788519 RepID=UPI00315D642D
MDFTGTPSATLIGSSNSPSHQHLNGKGDYDILDMVTADMDFEQAYLMYNSLQQKQAINSMEQLEKVQMLNQNYVTEFSHPVDLQHDSSSSSTTTFDYHRSQILNNNNSNHIQSSNQHHNQQQQMEDEYEDEVEEENQFDQFFSNTESNALEIFLDNLTNTANPLQFYNTAAHNPEIPLFDLHTMKQPTYHSQPHQQQPQQVQHQHQQPHQLTAARLEHENLRQELTDAFSHPSLKSMSLSGPTTLTNNNNSQLPTPVDSRQSSYSNTGSHIYVKQHQQQVFPSGMDTHNFNNNNDEFDDEDDDEDDSNNDEEMLTPPASDVEARKLKNSSSVINGTPIKKKRRSSTKPLLSIEQKRLNHSHSEQKRRQLCKLAYQRCLELIIDIDAFNKLPELNEAERKSKRARINKEGLPNLSKHNALVRISNEMLLIKGMNEKLRSLIEHQ